MVLHGEIQDTRDEQIAALQADVRRLTREVAAANADAESAHRETAKSLASLRRQLSPLFQALKAVFGELDAVGVNEGATEIPSAVNPRTSAVWDAWKSRLGSGPAAVIDALLLHGRMNTQQLAIATGRHRTTIPSDIHKLKKAGLIDKSGDDFSLKQL